MNNENTKPEQPIAEDPAPAPTGPRSGVAPSRLADAFWSYHLTNPVVYESLVRLSRQAVKAGRKKIGIGALFERLRWEFWVTSSERAPRLNNNYRSRYARLIMEREADLNGVFTTRGLRA